MHGLLRPAARPSKRASTATAGKSSSPAPWTHRTRQQAAHSLCRQRPAASQPHRASRSGQSSNTLCPCRSTGGSGFHPASHKKVSMIASRRPIPVGCLSSRAWMRPVIARRTSSETWYSDGRPATRKLDSGPSSASPQTQARSCAAPKAQPKPSDSGSGQDSPGEGCRSPARIAQSWRLRSRPACADTRRHR